MQVLNSVLQRSNKMTFLAELITLLTCIIYNYVCMYANLNIRKGIYTQNHQIPSSITQIIKVAIYRYALFIGANHWKSLWERKKQHCSTLLKNNRLLLKTINFWYNHSQFYKKTEQSTDSHCELAKQSRKNIRNYPMQKILIFVFLIINSSLFSMNESIDEYVIGGEVGRIEVTTGVFSVINNKLQLIHEYKKETKNITDFTKYITSVVTDLKNEHDITIKRACFGAPGNTNAQKTGGHELTEALIVEWANQKEVP